MRCHRTKNQKVCWSLQLVCYEHRPPRRQKVRGGVHSNRPTGNGETVTARRLPNASAPLDDKLFLISDLSTFKTQSALIRKKRLAMGSRFFRKADDSDSDTESSDEESLTSGDEAPKPAAPAKPKSRFLRSGDSSDSDSPSEEEDSDSSEEEQKPAAAAKGVSDSEEEDSDEEVKKVVKSAKDKRLEDMEATGTAMNNALKINDWIAISAGELGIISGCGRRMTQLQNSTNFYE